MSRPLAAQYVIAQKLLKKLCSRSVYLLIPILGEKGFLISLFFVFYGIQSSHERTNTVLLLTCEIQRQTVQFEHCSPLTSNYMCNVQGFSLFLGFWLLSCKHSCSAVGCQHNIVSTLLL